MGAKTGIAWTDSTWNPWIGCTKVGPGCDHCYAENVDKRMGGGHWGSGAERRITAPATRNAPLLWNQRANGFQRTHGRPQRVFALSLGDWADNEVPPDWQSEMWRIIHETNRLRYQLCTKRVTNIANTLPANWNSISYSHVGFLITCVNQKEADRDIPKLLDLKARFGFRWVGISYEPALGRIIWRLKWFQDAGLDWIICGGESGSHARDDDRAWYQGTLLACQMAGCAFFMKQMAHLRPIPDDLMIREFPEALNG